MLRSTNNLRKRAAANKRLKRNPACKRRGAGVSC